MDERSFDSNQRISGNHHQIAGRDHVTNVSTLPEPEFDEHSPYKIDCPQCNRVTGRYSATCRNCEFEVKKYFDDIEIERQRKAEEKRKSELHDRGLMFVFGGFGGFIGLNWLGFTSLILMGLMALCVGAGCMMMNSSK